MGLGDLPAIARQLSTDLRANRRVDLTEMEEWDLQALGVAEEAGELVGAYRRWSGRARRKGSFEDMAQEVADVIIVTAIFAQRVGIDLEKAVADKLTVIYSRGWKEPEPSP